MLQNTDQNSEQKRITAFHISLSLFKISSCIPIDFSTKTTDKQLIFTQPSHVQYKTITMIKTRPRHIFGDLININNSMDIPCHGKQN